MPIQKRNRLTRRTGRVEVSDTHSNGIRCVDPSVGERILDLTSSSGPGPDHDLLAAHLEICAHCRMTLDLEQSIAQGLRDGSLVAAEQVHRFPTWARSAAGAFSIAALAASLILMVFLPPVPGGPVIAPRGTTSEFLRPVEGEVVSVRGLKLTWTPIPGARSYRVRIEETGTEEGARWTGTTSESFLEITADGLATEKARYRAVLATVPDDLLGRGDISVAFRTGNFAEVAWYRMTHAKLPVRVLLGVGLLAGLVLLPGKRLGRGKNYERVRL